ncbi:MAG: DUF2145 domain-containing protein [Pseudomonadota bacterium]|nr:DUF2145 domain-containing protein [Pseudomonadota bacterium]
MRLRNLCLAWLLALPLPLWAGQSCKDLQLPPETVAEAATTALTVADALDARNAPVALVARVGSDLSSYGLTYSHAGFAVRDHPNGRWTVVHLLNQCGSDRSSLYAQGLVNFFLDDLVNQDARIVWLPEDMADRLATHLIGIPRNHLLGPRYNLIARPGSPRMQNSTAWMLETLAIAQLPDPPASISRALAFRTAQQHGFTPDTIRIAYGKRVLGGLFSPNTDFTDHPVATRLNGQYPVVTVRAILRYMDNNDLIIDQAEWRGGQLQTTPGPG